MLQILLSLLALILCVVSLGVLFKTWFGKSWFFSWLKGTLGFICLGLIASVVFLMLDLWSYKLALKEQALADIHIKQLDEAYFVLKFKVNGEHEQKFQILGDQWQLDMRLLTWKGPFLTLGFEPIYRFERLSGRYANIDDERLKQRTVYPLNTSSFVDLWRISQIFDFWLHANYGSSLFMPLTDNAKYTIFLSARGLVAKPMNKEAESAVNKIW